MNKAIRSLLTEFQNLPFIGKKNAERFVHSILESEPKKIERLASLLNDLSHEKNECPSCGAVIMEPTCSICNDENRENILCLVENSKDMYKIELAGIFNGKYHILKGHISPFLKQNFEDLNVRGLKDRIKNENIKEIIIALPFMNEYEITIDYLLDFLIGIDIPITKMATGIPSGHVLENIDEITLKNAFKGRRNAKD